MNSLLFYLFQVSIIFSGFYLVYKWLFSRFTFHVLNRFILLLLIPISLLLPFSDLLFPQMEHFAIEIPLINNFTAFSNFDYLFTEETKDATSQMFDWQLCVLAIYFIGVVSYLTRFILTTYRLLVLKRNAKKEISNGTTLHITNTSTVFSYFKWIFVPKSKNNFYNELVITHEKAHIQLWHSMDVIFLELFIAFCWFHPLVYLYRKSLKSIHEFQADAFVLKHKVKKSTYLELLLMSLEPTHTNPVYNYFSHPTLKKRIEMITKSQSKSRFKLTYLLLIPIIALGFMAFKTSTNNTVNSINIQKTIHSNHDNKIPSISPIHEKDKQRISSLFGVQRKHPKLKSSHRHGGIDIVAKIGAPVVATADGIVAKAKNEGNWGNLVIISHANNFETWYAHLKGFNIKEHATVKKGDTIGYVGATGLSTGPHLHYEVHQNGKRLDPMKHIDE